MEKLKVGIIGMGYIGESHIDAVRRIGLCKLHAVADTNYAVAKAKAEANNVKRCYATVDEMLADPEIDAIHNCTPNFLHAEINRRIIESGKHLFSEKPLTRTYREAKELCACAKKHPQLVTAVNFNYRMNPMVQEMRHRIMNGEAGEVRIVSGAYQQDYLLYDTDYTWRLEKDIAGISCCIADIGSHWMDAVQHVTGLRITAVMADLATMIPIRKKPLQQAETFRTNAAGAYESKTVENEDYGAFLFRMENGAHGLFHASEVSAGHGCCFAFEVNGSQQSYRWNQEENDRMWVGVRDGDNHAVIRNPNTMSPQVRQYTSLAMGHPEGWNDAFCGNIRAFYRAITEDREAARDFASLEDAAYIVRLTEAIVKSSVERRWVDVAEITE